MGSSYKYRWSFTHLSAIHLLLCSLVPTGQGPVTGCGQGVGDHWLKQQRIIFSQFWSLEFQDHVCRVAVFWGLWGKELSPASRLVDSHLLPVSSRHLLSVCVCIQISSSSKGTSHSALGPILSSYFNLIISLKILSLNTTTFWRPYFQIQY